MNNEEKILSILMDMQGDISSLKTNVTEINEKVDRLDQRMDRLEARMDSLEARMDILESRVNSLEEQTASLRTDINSLTFRVTKLERSHYELRSEVDKINILLETQLIPIQNEILNCYFSTFQRYKESTNDIEQLKLDVDVLKSTIQG